MEVVAKLRYLRIAPRKVRLVADLIRRKSVEEAQSILSFTTKKAAPILMKLLKSAVANAKNNFGLAESNLYIAKIVVDEGPKYKRWMPRARGHASEIQKKTCHVTIWLDEIVKNLKELKKEKKAKRPTIEKIPKKEKPKFRPQSEAVRPRIEKGIERIFRRKAF